MPPQPANWDRVGVFYVSFCAIWTTIVLIGMAFCWYHRELPIIKVRGIPLAFGSVIFLHLYWCMAQITYPVGATMPIVIAYSVQYWVMGIWFPLGIALYHASNLRFLYIAKRQRTFAHPDLREKREGCNGKNSSWFCRMRNLEYLTKVMTFIVMGIIFQVWRHINTVQFAISDNPNRPCSLLECGWPAPSITRSLVSLVQGSKVQPCQSS